LATDASIASTAAAPRRSTARVAATLLDVGRSVRRAVSTRPVAALIDGAQPYSLDADMRRSQRRSARQLDVLVADAAQRQGLVCARSLGRAGLAVGLVENRADAPAFHSRWCAAKAVVPDCATDADAFVDALLSNAVRHGARVLVPLHDGSIHSLRQRRTEVEQHVALALASEKALDVAVTKAKTLALAAQLGVPIPRTIAAQSSSDVRAAAQELGFPMIVKPSSSWVEGQQIGRRLACRLVVDRAEAVRTVEAFARAGAESILQEWLDGAREAVSVFRAEGRIWARFAQVAYRMNPPVGGSSVVRESIPLQPALIEAAEQLVDACDLDAYSEIEFRRDSRGQPRLMEINARLSASVEIAVRAGVDFPLLLYRWAAGEPLRPVAGFRTGVRMRWLGGDLAWLRQTLASRGRPEAEPTLQAVGSFCAEFLRPSSYDYLDRGDLRPALTAAGSWAARAIWRRTP
jgi:predicted ATP-grasp superfamily ATP-dependent carboligase